MQQNYPQKSDISYILKQAFFYWSKTLGYQIMYSLIYLSVLITVWFLFAEHYGILNDYLKTVEMVNSGSTYAQAQEVLVSNPNYITFSWIIIGTFIFLYPLNLGLLKMYRKTDLGEKINVHDLFAGYMGVNFFIYISYYVFWFMVFLYMAPTVILAGVWIALTVFTAPLMFFMNRKIFETFRYNIRVWRNFFPAMLVSLLVAAVFKYAGMLTIIGLPFTMAFPTAMIYALYSSLFKEHEEVQ